MFRKKLKDSRGESLIEVLVALLISSVGILLLAGMIGASTNIISKSRASLEAYYQKNNKLEQQGSSSGSYDKTGNVAISKSVGGPTEEIPVKYYINKQGTTSVISYK